MDMPPDRGAERKILVGLVVILPDCMILFGTVVIRRNIGKVRRKKDMFGQDNRAAAEDGHGANRVA